MPFYWQNQERVSKKFNYFHGVPTKIPIVLNNGLNYKFHFVIQHLPNIFDSCDFECLGKNTEK